ncbi:MAG: hypothetical protein D6800_13630 [Candidatus Zixiibacteriota bacterium]|nr:MAG: hypothetical protein D6800_13630 [candidate division Zixibacteria bacterium]
MGFLPLRCLILLPGHACQYSRLGTVDKPLIVRVDFYTMKPPARYPENSQLTRTIFTAFVFAAAMAYFEAAVVVYLRQSFYPQGFAFPLKPMPAGTLVIELGREAATIIMLIAVAFLTGKGKWERFGWFLFLFGVWDIGYYFWLKVLIDWPATLFDWDILFLIPIPWIGPVVAPVLVSLTMIVIGLWFAVRSRSRNGILVGSLSWTLGVLGSLVLLYSFMSDTAAGLHGQEPQPYRYWLLALGLICYWVGFAVLCRSNPHRM